MCLWILGEKGRTFEILESLSMRVWLIASIYEACRRRQWHPTPALLPGKSHGWRSLEGCSPWGCWGSDTTEQLPFHFSLLCIGEGNGNPLQCSCLENPRDGGAWWPAVSGVAQSRTRLKWLSNPHQTLKKCGDEPFKSPSIALSNMQHSSVPSFGRFFPPPSSFLLILMLQL